MSDWMEVARALISLLVVAGLMLACAYVVKRFGLEAKLSGIRNQKQRLNVLEMRYIDPKNKLLLIACDGREHLILVSASGNLVVESRGGI